MPPITFNAVGDIIALLQVGSDVVKLVKETRGAKTDHHELSVEVNAIQELLDAIRAQPSLQQDLTISKSLSRACDQVASALALLAGFTFETNAHAGNALSRFSSHLRAKLSAPAWAFRGGADARKKIGKLSMTLQALNAALLVASGANTRQQIEALQQSIDSMSRCVTGLATESSATKIIAEDISRDLGRTRDLTESAAATLDAVQTMLSTHGRGGGSTGSLQGNRQTVTISEAQLRQIAMSVEVLHLLQGLHARNDVIMAQQASMMALLEQRQQTSSIFAHLSPRPLGCLQLTVAFTSIVELSGSIISASVIVDVCVGSLVTFALSSSSTPEQVAYALCACLLLVGSCTLRLYKSPRVVHVVIVVDLFGDSVEVPCEDARSPAMLHGALERTFRGRFGSLLMQRHMYEIRFACDLSAPHFALSTAWVYALKPGQKLLMNACVSQDVPGSDLRCPACAALAPISCTDRDRWLKCSRCPASFEWSSALSYNRLDLPRAPRPSRDSTNKHHMEDYDNTQSSSRRAPETPEPDDDPDVLQHELSLCKRIRILRNNALSSSFDDSSIYTHSDYWVPPSGCRIPLSAAVPFPSALQALQAPCEDANGAASYIGSAIVRYGVYPCKIVPSLAPGPACRLTLDGKEIATIGRYDLLPFDRTRMEFVRAANGTPPSGRRPIQGGHEEDGRLLYHAVATLGNIRVPGRTAEHIGGALVPFGGREHFVEHYEILCWRD